APLAHRASDPAAGLVDDEAPHVRERVVGVAHHVPLPPRPEASVRAPPARAAPAAGEQGGEPAQVAAVPLHDGLERRDPLPGGGCRGAGRRHALVRAHGVPASVTAPGGGTAGPVATNPRATDSPGVRSRFQAGAVAVTRVPVPV